MKKVSILIPLYNSENFIKETIECCLKQTYPNIEIIIVDDGSTDNSLEIAKSFKNENITIISQTNSGGCVARNRAFELSTGEYIMYLDADDLISPNKIECQMQILASHNDYKVVATCPYEEFTDSTNVTFRNRKIYKDYECGLDLLEDEWIFNDCFTVSCFLTHRKLIEETGPWNKNLVKNQDGEFFCRVLSKASYIKYCSKAQFFYRRGHISVSTKSRLNPAQVKSSLESRIIYEKTVLPLRDTQRMRKGLAKCFGTVMLNSVYNSDFYLEAKKHILKLGYKPSHPSPNFITKIVEKLIGFEGLLYIKQKINNLKSINK